MNVRRWSHPLLGTLILVSIWAVVASSATAQTREEKVREDRRRVEGDGFWIYNDWAAALAEATKSGKPIVVVLRCIPCEECVKLDDNLVDEDPVLRPLLDKFVRVRLVSTNGLNLNLFQYDFDQSFAVFLLNADGTIYGRFGTRSHRTEWVGDVSLEGLARALEGALALHAGYPANRDSLAGKVGKPLEFTSPEQYPALRDKYSSQLATSGEIVKSCIHCHQIGDAQKEFYRTKNEPIPESILFPYPHPKVIGLTFDPRTTARIKTVESGSPADRAGLRSGDLIKTLGSQPILSTADVQWALHHTSPDGALVDCEVVRDSVPMQVKIQLPDGWRREGDLSWRVSSWGLRRMTTGGMVLESISSEERSQLGIQSNHLALRVKHVGKYRPNSIAHEAGIKIGDIVVQFGGRDDLETETDLLAYGLHQFKPGEKVSVSIRRDGKPLEFKLLMQP